MNTVFYFTGRELVEVHGPQGFFSMKGAYQEWQAQQIAYALKYEFVVRP